MDNLNPIPFNPDTMTISQAKECVETLRTLFAALNRGAGPEHITGLLDQARANMASKYGDAK